MTPKKLAQINIDDPTTWWYDGIVNAMQTHTEALKKMQQATAKGDSAEVIHAIAALLISVYAVAECYGISRAGLDGAIDMYIKEVAKAQAAKNRTLN